MMKDRRTRRRIILAAPLGAALLTARVPAPAFAQGQQPPGKSTPAPTSGSGSAPSAGSAGRAGRVDAHLRQLAARRPKDTIAVLVHRTKKGKSAGLDAVKAHGRRVGDDTVDILLRLWGGELQDKFGGNSCAVAGQLSDNVDGNDVPYLRVFPYLGLPHEGFSHEHDHGQP